MLTLDIVCPSYNRSDLLGKCLESVREAAKKCPIKFRICLVVSQADRESKEVIEHFSTSSRNEISVSVIEVEERVNRNQARNSIVRKSRADWLLFLDDDTILPGDFFCDFYSLRQTHPAVDVFGGPNLNPPDSQQFEKICGAALASSFGSYFGANRYQPKQNEFLCRDERKFTLCNLFFSRRVKNLIQFPLDLKSAEENWVLQKVAESRCLFMFSPLLFVWHRRRNSIKGFARQLFSYGFGRGQCVRMSPEFSQLGFFVPSICVLFTVVTLLLGWFFSSLTSVWFLLFSIYILLGGLASLVQSRDFSLKLWEVFGCWAVFSLIHVSYGVGILCGFVTGFKDAGYSVYDLVPSD